MRNVAQRPCTTGSWDEIGLHQGLPKAEGSLPIQRRTEKIGCASFLRHCRNGPIPTDVGYRNGSSGGGKMSHERGTSETVFARQEADQ